MLLTAIVKFTVFSVSRLCLIYDSTGCMWNVHYTASLLNAMLYHVKSNPQFVNVLQSANLAIFAIYCVNIKKIRI